MPDMTHPPRPQDGRLNDLWDKPVKDLVLLTLPELSDEAKERHRMYCDLLMSLVAFYWNGNKRGRAGKYPGRDGQKGPDGQYLGGDYLGHNIACIAVDATGEVIDFDFNHNEILFSSVEHAESRLIRRVFSLTQLNNGWAVKNKDEDTKPTPPTKPVTYSNLLTEVTVYTSLESCSQCSGIMALGDVKEIVFLQRDPTQNSIGNILWNLGPQKPNNTPPLPIPADFLDVDAFAQLDAAYQAFLQGGANQPFYIAPDGIKEAPTSITSFLCTDAALNVFKAGLARFEANSTLSHPDYKPAQASVPAEEVKSNAGVLNHVHRFFDYATRSGRRGTPHKL